jgi:hypothetical protein
VLSGKQRAKRKAAIQAHRAENQRRKEEEAKQLASKPKPSGAFAAKAAQRAQE